MAGLASGSGPLFVVGFDHVWLDYGRGQRKSEERNWKESKSEL